jgi:protease PrsW
MVTAVRAEQTAGMRRHGHMVRPHAGLVDWQPYSIITSLAFVPPFLMMLYFWRLERVNRNPFRVVLFTFLYGATAGIAIAMLLHEGFNIGFAAPNGNWGLPEKFVAVVIAAPIVEELSKGFGMGLVRPHGRELEDGIIYGASVGLGFAATENFLYGLQALNDQGVDLAIWTVGLRIFSSMLLHLGASALLGYGYARMVVRRDPFPILLPYYLLAVGLHAVYNFLVTVDGEGYIALFAALFMVAAVVALLKSRIEALDALPHTDGR